MTTHFSSTADDTSETGQKVQQALRQAADEMPEDRAARLRDLIRRIKALEERGFIRRQEFSAPTTGEFERQFAHLKKRDDAA